MTLACPETETIEIDAGGAITTTEVDAIDVTITVGSNNASALLRLATEITLDAETIVEGLLTR